MSEERRAVGSLIQILADLPEFLRRPMLQRRLAEFFTSGEQMQRETVRNALDAAGTIPAGKLAVLVKTWLEKLAEFEPAKRNIMFHAYCAEILRNPGAFKRLDLALITESFLSLPESKRRVLSDSLHEVLLSLPVPSRIIELAPERSLAALGLR